VGLPFKAAAGYGTNFRSLKNHLWRGWLDRAHRCVVPATAFSEPDRNTPKGAVVWRWFERADKQPFFFAGIWRPGPAIEAASGCPTSATIRCSRS
jgi:putative SOS response-associated peptidase YedK